MTKPVLLCGVAGIPDPSGMSTKELLDHAGGNTGNLAFRHAAVIHLGEDTKRTRRGTPAENIRAMGDLALFVMANHLGAHADLGTLSEQLGELKLPAVAIGLGAQSGLDMAIPQVPPGTLRWIKAVTECAPSDRPNIGVRGPFTQKVLAHYGLAAKTVVIGCPSLFINPDPALGAKISAGLRIPRRIAVCAGNQHWQRLSAVEQTLTRLATKTSGSYVVQAPLELLQLARGESTQIGLKALTQCRDYVNPEFKLDEFIAWIGQHGAAFFDVHAWLSHLRRFDFVIGTRIHGIALAIQAGTPALCVVHDSRTLEMCQTMGIPHMLASHFPLDIQAHELPDLLDFNGESFDVRRRELCDTYVNFLRDNAIEPQPWLASLGGAAP